MPEIMGLMRESSQEICSNFARLLSFLLVIEVLGV